jgi:hypothetical protein
VSARTWERHGAELNVRRWNMSAGQFIFLLIAWLLINKLASLASVAAGEGRSWMESLAITEREHLAWLRAL